MSWVTNPGLLKIRSFSRGLGINRLIGSILNTQGYEATLASAMISSINLGDCVWDIGANIGHYTAKFAQLVGDAGCVIAFEPSPQNIIRLRGAVENFGNVVVVPKALSDHTGPAILKQGDDELGATSHLISSDGATIDTIHEITVTTGDAVQRTDNIRSPNVLKVDVEGHEGEVLDGLCETLSLPSLHDIFLEMHFRQLEARGKPNTPADIENLLRSKGFVLRWLDPSHLHAFRPTKSLHGLSRDVEKT